MFEFSDILNHLKHWARLDYHTDKSNLCILFAGSIDYLCILYRIPVRTTAFHGSLSLSLALFSTVSLSLALFSTVSLSRSLSIADTGLWQNTDRFASSRWSISILPPTIVFSTSKTISLLAREHLLPLAMNHSNAALEWWTYLRINKRCYYLNVHVINGLGLSGSSDNTLWENIHPVLPVGLVVAQ